MRFFLIFFALSFTAARADDVSPAQMEKALAETQALLSNPATRKKIMNENADTKAVDAKVRSLGGTEKNNQDIYELASDIFGNLTRDAKGNPDEMEKILQNAFSDPEGFGNKFSPEQKKRLREISLDLEKNKSLP